MQEQTKRETIVLKDSESSLLPFLLILLYPHWWEWICFTQCTDWNSSLLQTRVSFWFVCLFLRFIFFSPVIWEPFSPIYLAYKIRRARAIWEFLIVKQVRAQFLCCGFFATLQGNCHSCLFSNFGLFLSLMFFSHCHPVHLCLLKINSLILLLRIFRASQSRWYVHT